MATRAATFFPSASDEDVTFSPAELDVRKLVETVGGSDNSTQAQFGTGTGEIVLRPFASSSTTGDSFAPGFGWCLNRSGADGMAVPAVPAGIDSVVRFVPSGSWTFLGRLGSGSVTTGQYRLRVRVYRVSSGGSTSLLFGPVSSASVSPTVAGSDVSVSSSQPEFTFSQGETLLVSYSIEKTAGSVSSETIQFRLNDGGGNDCTVSLPGGIRTRFAESRQVDGVGASLLGTLAAGVGRSAAGVGTAVLDRSVSASKAVVTSGVGTAARSHLAALGAVEAQVTVGVSGRIALPLDELPSDGDFAGSDPSASISGTVFGRDGAAAVGATVLLFRQSDNAFIASTLTDGGGVYEFARDTADPNVYYVLAFTGDEDHGTSNRSLTPEV